MELISETWRGGEKPLPFRTWTIRLSIYLALTGLVFIAGNLILQPDGGYPPDPDLEKQKRLQRQWTQLFSILLVVPCLFYFIWGGVHIFQNGPWRSPPRWQTVLLAGLLTVISLIHGSLAGWILIILFG
ncbi:hypothetical protein [Desmospora profundinema]|uniref:Magnesium-transporting ATPase (P-type) n=1 Tax=Desmospora profundinema TaxID=1571184 RepID=A0ABU1IMW5_9BACL|nr:hypothetical protein [Desmospora profundinema]MDR6225892.1 magnesium-transporting ATPase (P-type) [Desmospora profundinema]